MDELADPAGDLLDALLACERQLLVCQLVSGLPVLEREVVCARFGLGPFDSHSLRQLAERMDVSLRTAWCAERRALGLLREACSALTEDELALLG